MRVTIDPVKCETIGICVRECPSFFRFEAGSKKAVPLAEEVPRELEEAVRKVACKCPTKAIMIYE